MHISFVDFKCIVAMSTSINIYLSLKYHAIKLDRFRRLLSDNTVLYLCLQRMYMIAMNTRFNFFWQILKKMLLGWLTSLLKTWSYQDLLSKFADRSLTFVILFKVPATMLSYNTRGPTMLHLPEVAELFQYICEIMYEHHCDTLPPPHFQVSRWYCRFFFLKQFI